MNRKVLKFNEEARKKMSEGIEVLYNSVSHTLGPHGSNTVFDRGEYSSPLVTNDGVSIAKEIRVKDEFQNVGVSLLREAAVETNRLAGDGTTTSIVLSKAMYDGGMKALDNNDPVTIRKGMLKASEDILKRLDGLGRSIDSFDEIRSVASISSSSKEFGEIIVRAFSDTKFTGIVQVEKGNTTETYSELVDGFFIESGLEDDLFYEDSKNEIKENNVMILNTLVPFTKTKEINGFLNILNDMNVPGIIIGTEFSDEIKRDLLINFQRGIKCYPIVAPSFAGERIAALEDVSALTNAPLIKTSDNMTFDLMNAGDFAPLLGEVKTLKIKKDALIFEELVDKTLIEKRLKELRTSNAKKERMAKLDGGIATIFVGGDSQVAVNENYLRVEDAINATRSAIDEGVIIGGGSTLLGVSREWLNSEGPKTIGEEIVYSALSKPFEVICKNSGIEVTEEMKEEIENGYKENKGLNAETGIIDDLFEVGVLDPIKTTKSAIKSSISVVSTMLTTRCIIVDEKEDTKRDFRSFLKK